ncbi:hypothetical protein WICMUC_001873 [Wickerhamomyces mucosus]|uniref:BTB domain-containing protein n=1 Tax=Wickerhamomyces mucosus TaxID=1378264 RepID=A0A9P8TEZ4_9ASCO|nr:hypothetical protein WICMUC_001873 [Wickerhamomyces mucosus]
MDTTSISYHGNGKSSMIDNSSHVAPQEDPKCPFGCCDTTSLNDFIWRKGFFEGTCSDITIKAFDEEYKLHKLILFRSGYFRRLFEGMWGEIADSTHELKFDHDPDISKDAFEMAMARLYGGPYPTEKNNHILSMIAIGQYLDIPDIVCTCTNIVINSLNMENIGRFSKFAANRNYGKASERILENTRGYLCSDGWQSGIEKWDGIPCSVIASVVGMDSFFVPNEWERILFCIKLIERRQKDIIVGESETNDEDDDDIDLIIESLNTKVHYCHLKPEQLQKLEKRIYKNNEPLIDPSVLRDALWLSIKLHEKVATIDKRSCHLGITTTSETPANNIDTWFVPTKDGTLYGTPEYLSKIISEHHNINEDQPNGKSTEIGYHVSTIPPFRFSVAFSNVSDLEPEKRVYAKTLSYAGSYWNLYIQKIKHKKGYQIGVYVHRASSIQPSKNGIINRDIFERSTNDDSSSNINGLNGDTFNISSQSSKSDISGYPRLNYAGESRPKKVRKERFPELNASHITKSGNRDLSFEIQKAEEEINTKLRLDEYIETSDDDKEFEDSEEKQSFLAYEDSRLKTSLYYVLYTPSRKSKNALTCFISTPDLFNKSQSWGWKSNSMCSFNANGTLASGQDEILKFMIVLGST